MEKSVRPTAVAGLFYPSDEHELQMMLAELFAHTTKITGVPQAIIAPHAGYIYSGPVAAQVYKQVEPAHDKIHRVLLLGPCHRVPVAGVALSSADFFETPLGAIPVDQKAQLTLLSIPGVEISDYAHQEEHSLEVQIPFLQQVLDQFSIIPIVVGGASPTLVQTIIERFAEDPQTLVVVSSDLSHYHEYLTAQKLDHDTTTLIEHLDFKNLKSDRACGAYPIRGLLAYAQAHGLHATTVMQNNSGDTAGDRTHVVGYGGYVFQ